MAYTANDPRQAFRVGLGTQKYRYEGDDEILNYTLAVKDNDGEDVDIPMYLSEEVKSEQLPIFPFMEFELPPDSVSYEPHDILAATRKIEAYVLIHIYYTDTDNISAKDFGKKIKDKLQDCVRSNQSTTAGITFMNIENDGYSRETDGRQVVYHYTAILYCLYYDLC